MTPEKKKELLETAYDQLELVVFPRDYFTVLELRPLPEYKNERYLLDYSNALTKFLYESGIGSEDESNENRRRMKIRMAVRELFIKLNNPRTDGPSSTNTFSDLRYQVESEKAAYLMIGKHQDFNSNPDAKYSIIDGDHFLWGITYGPTRTPGS